MMVAGPGPAIDGLRGHIAAANPQAEDIREGRPARVPFRGPHCYVSPRDYGPGFHVPTWNYVAVSVAGRLRPLAAPGEALALLDTLVVRHETGDESPEPPWKRDAGDAATSASSHR